MQINKKFLCTTSGNALRYFVVKNKSGTTKKRREYHKVTKREMPMMIFIKLFRCKDREFFIALITTM